MAPLCRQTPTALPPSAFDCIQASDDTAEAAALRENVCLFSSGGGKARAKGKGGASQNPRGRDGQVLKCHRCGSTSHLIKRCPQPEGAASSGLAMMTAVGTSSLQFHAVTHENLQYAAARASSALASGQVRHGMIDELESLRSVATASSRKRVESVVESDVSESADFSRNPAPKFPPPETPAPSRQEIQQSQLMRQQAGEWTTIATGISSVPSNEVPQGIDSFTSRLLSDMMQLQTKRQTVEEDVQSSTSSQTLMKSSDRKTKRAEKDSEEQKKARAATTLQLSQLLCQMPGQNASSNDDAAQGSGSSSQGASRDVFPWWEVGTGDAVRNHSETPAYTTHEPACLVDK